MTFLSNRNLEYDGNVVKSRETTVMIERNLFDWRNWVRGSHLQSSFFLELMFLYQAKPRIRIEAHIRYGRPGSTQLNVVAILLVPAASASNGVMQQRDAANAVNALRTRVDFI